MISWNDGDVYRFEVDGGTTVTKVIVKAFEKYAVTLRAFPTPQWENNHEIVLEGRSMHVNAGRLMTWNENAFSANYIGSLSEKEYRRLIKAVCEALGAETLLAGKQEPNKELAELKEMLARSEGTAQKAEKEPAENRTEGGQDSALQMELAVVTKERDVYKAMYQEVLDRMFDLTAKQGRTMAPAKAKQVSVVVDKDKTA